MLNIALRDELLALERADLELREQLADEHALSGAYNDRMAALHRLGGSESKHHNHDVVVPSGKTE